MINILFENEIEEFELSEELWNTIHKVIQGALEEESFIADTEISLTFTGDEDIKTINNEFRGIDKKTDVLSFPMYEPEDIDEMVGKEFSETIALGDIVVSIETARAQAKEYGHSFERELCFLIVHSMFHLLGYDHQDEESTEIMRGKEEGVLEKLGILRLGS